MNNLKTPKRQKKTFKDIIKERKMREIMIELGRFDELD